LSAEPAGHVGLRGGDAGRHKEWHAAGRYQPLRRGSHRLDSSRCGGQTCERASICACTLYFVRSVAQVVQGASRARYWDVLSLDGNYGFWYGAGRKEGL